MDCLFCKIIKKELPAEIIYEDNNAVVFKDIYPKAPIHFLIVSKKHIASVNDLKPEDKELMSELFLVAQKVARENNLNGYKLHINVGREGGQLVEHLHMHLLSGKPMEMP
ncbi:MAG: histidine triad nucleotide-binding protein [Candidatus Nealsonbacteria bacterium CG_4_10_14_0_2_um_filter_38_17]|uniref:Histidine triad nucleotide-binding protein n=2 Tax=Candidatus Nealsoniibacteriota TaxID=1817911 RepID=A0A2M7UYQ5_9BACT|nr:MAG: histidine triad nucleotide-binding protein [Candidatus Nealsonbacteria bacterium CG23_combo_of_CG06-09_8_20_14_all_38_19]PIZ89080.1 MAG: histidine triad nucleotide-binding protein [Candidatus Nealsonbacteria bacterium CG_4_10_14_0_2_um_filter_38_17]